MTNGLATADYIILAGFFVVLLGVGVFYSGRMHNLRDFFSGNRQVPWWLAGISLYMTTFSAFTFVSYSAVAYKHGFVAVTVWWFSIPGCLLSAWFLASRWRRAATTSPVEYIETRFTPFLRQCFSWFGIPLIVLDDALKLFVIGGMIAASMGYMDSGHTVIAIAISGTIILGYTLLGGLWAVLITDFVQFVVMGIAVVVLVPLAWRAAGSLGAIVEHSPDSFSRLTSEDYNWPWLLSFAFILALTFATKWPYVQRYYAARDGRDARRVGYLVAALTFLLPPVLFFPAFASRVFLPEPTDLNQVYPLICQMLLPVGMMGILLAAMFSATMSMLSSDYNSLASVITNDIVKRIFLPNASDRTQVLLARLATLVAAAAAMVIAILFAQVEGLEDLVKIMARLFAGLLPPVALPMIAGLVTRRTSGRGALLGFALGAACGTAAYLISLIDAYSFLQKVQFLTWITTLPTAIGLWAGSVLFPDSAEKRVAVNRFLEGIESEPAEKIGLVESGDAAVAARIIGLTTALLGIILVVGVLFSAGVAEGKVSLIVGSIMACGGLLSLAISGRLDPTRSSRA